jgi:hypothetical protein
VFDVGSIIDGYSVTNDNAQESAAITSLQSTNAASVSLQCGKYYLTRLTGNAKTIHAEGPIALFVDGQVQVTNLTVTLAPGATVDLFSDSGFGVSIAMNVGDITQPWRTRIYVETSTVNLQGTVNFYGNLYAPASDYTTGSSQTIYGAVLVKKLNNNNPLTIHYDSQIIDSTCDPPPPPPGEHACNSCRDCANQACYDGPDADNLRECTTCRNDADCCAPLVCDGTGTCVAPGSF